MLCEKEPLFLNGLVTGVVIAIKGTPLPGGEFEMEEICYPDLAPQSNIPMQIQKKVEQQVNRTQSTRESVGLNAWTFTVILGCLTVEWLLRKRWALM